MDLNKNIRRILLTMLSVGAISGASEAFGAEPPTSSRQFSVHGIPVRVLRVQQYEDRMPVAVDPGESPEARTITLVEIGFEACAPIRDEEFEIGVRESDGVQFLAIAPSVPDEPCEGREPLWQKATVGTSRVLPGRPVVIANPTLVEVLPPVE